MNIFILDQNPACAAMLHNDKHVVKMILESAQLLSTAHRVCDGMRYEDRTAQNRRITRWRLHDDRDGILLKATHASHPCAVWSRSHTQHYRWLFDLYTALLTEYTHRYHKHHAYDPARSLRLYQHLQQAPAAISHDDHQRAAPPKAMPDQFKTPSQSVMDWEATVQSYHQYYREAKASFSTWKQRPIPSFMQLCGGNSVGRVAPF